MRLSDWNRVTATIGSTGLSARWKQKYEAAQQELDTIVGKWKDWSNAYSLKAEVYLHQKDTVQAEKWLDKSLQLNPYDGDAWTTRAYMALARKEWKRQMRR